MLNSDSPASLPQTRSWNVRGIDFGQGDAAESWLFSAHHRAAVGLPDGYYPTQSWPETVNMI